MQKVISTDGTEIAFERSGSGPALIIVGGSLADHRFYVPLANELSRHFTVYNYDRRGADRAAIRAPTPSNGNLRIWLLWLTMPENRCSSTGTRLARR